MRDIVAEDNPRSPVFGEGPAGPRLLIAQSPRRCPVVDPSSSPRPMKVRCATLTTNLTTTLTTAPRATTPTTGRHESCSAWSHAWPASGSVGVRGSNPLSSTFGHPARTDSNPSGRLATLEVAELSSAPSLPIAHAYRPYCLLLFPLTRLQSKSLSQSVSRAVVDRGSFPICRERRAGCRHKR
ncbi:MAG: hypothetical protein QOI90_129 [Mycobacterium sp.]|jgi:hypothetical protein|nr:hypothetical protein [Mycobacterium sp.]